MKRISLAPITTLRLGASAVLLCLAGVCNAQVAVIVAPDAGTLMPNQMANIYLGRSFEFKPFDMPEGSPQRALFYKRVTDKDLDQIAAAWSRVVFTGKGQPPKQLADSAAIKRAVAANPKAIGYIDAADVDSTVKVIMRID